MSTNQTAPHTLQHRPLDTAAAPVAADLVIVVCPSCDLDFGAERDAPEATYLAGVHNDLHHGGHPHAHSAAATQMATTTVPTAAQTTSPAHAAPAADTQHAAPNEATQVQDLTTEDLATDFATPTDVLLDADDYEDGDVW